MESGIQGNQSICRYVDTYIQIRDFALRIFDDLNGDPIYLVTFCPNQFPLTFCLCDVLSSEIFSE